MTAPGLFEGVLGLSAGDPDGMLRTLGREEISGEEKIAVLMSLSVVARSNLQQVVMPSYLLWRVLFCLGVRLPGTG